VVSVVDKQIRILSGLHAGAQLLCEHGAQYLIGADRSCSIVLCDLDIAAKHCLVSVDSFGVMCRAIDAPFTLDGKPVAAGQVVSLEDFQVVQCGTVQLSIGPAAGDWPDVEDSGSLHAVTALDAVRSLKRLNPYVLFATVLFGLTCVLGLAYATLSDGEPQLTSSSVAAARQWLATIAPRGSELEIGVEGPQGSRLLLSGYVADARQLAKLNDAARRSGRDLRIEVYAIDDMLSSLTRLAGLASIPCMPQYQGSGRVACTNVVDNAARATRLQMIARDVPGLRTLDVDVAPQPIAPPPAPSPAPQAAPVQLSEKFAVLMFRDRRYLIGRHGKRYVEGEEFDGFRIKRIELDQILFEREGRSYEFRVAALGAAR
jgi:type III secretion system YscD/HrpQ family protein